MPQRARGLKKIDRSLRDWKFRAIDRGLKFSIEPFSVHYEGPVNGNSGIEIFDRDWNFRSGLKISSRDWNFRSGLNFFDRRALWGHKSRSSYAVKVGSCTTFYGVEIPLFQGIFTPYDPPFYGIFWEHIFLLIWGVGVVEIICIVLRSGPPATGLAKPKTPKVLGRVPVKRELLGGLLGTVLGPRELPRTVRLKKELDMGCQLLTRTIPCWNWIEAA